VVWEPLWGRAGGCWANKEVMTLPARATAAHMRSNLDIGFSMVGVAKSTLGAEPAAAAQ
jgi:hypothetical protein